MLENERQQCKLQVSQMKCALNCHLLTEYLHMASFCSQRDLTCRKCLLIRKQYSMWCTRPFILSHVCEIDQGRNSRTSPFSDTKRQFYYLGSTATLAQRQAPSMMKCNNRCGSVFRLLIERKSAFYH